jgi:hypothetical protein
VKNGRWPQPRAQGPGSKPGQGSEPDFEDESDDEEGGSSSDDDAVTSDIVQSLLGLAKPRTDVIPEVASGPLKDVSLDVVI